MLSGPGLAPLAARLALAALAPATITLPELAPALLAPARLTAIELPSVELAAGQARTGVAHTGVAAVPATDLALIVRRAGPAAAALVVATLIVPTGPPR